MRNQLARALALFIAASLSQSAIAENAASSASAASAAQSISVPAGDLREALKSLARQTSSNLVFRPEQVDGLKTHGVSGDMTTQDALAILLKGTTLQVNLDERTGAILIAAPKEERKSTARTERGVLRVAESDAVGTQSNTRGMSKVQDASGQPADSSASKIQEIVVTAQKREEKLSEVPMSIAVVTADDIDRRGLVSAEDYLRGLPGVNQTSDSIGQTITIRGIESSPAYQNAGSGSTVATYFGETPTTASGGLSTNTNVDVKLVDIERVEVLRGPQGTGLGSSSLGGAVRTIPVAPRLDRIEGKLAAGYSATSGTGGENYNVQAVGNFPLSKDKFALRVVGYRYDDAGYYRNRAGSSPDVLAALAPWGAEAYAVDADHIGDSTSTGGRMSALFQANEKLKFTLSYLTQKTEIDGAPLANSGHFEQQIIQVAPEHVTRGQRNGLTDMDIDIANAVMEYEFDWAHLLATYSHTKSGSLNSGPFGLIPLSYSSDSDYRADVGEVRLVTELEGAWNFLAGIYFEDSKDDQYANYYWYGDPATNPLPGFSGERFVGEVTHQRKLEQKAAFGEVSWEFLRNVTLTGGVRAYDYKRTGGQDGDGAFFGPTGVHQRITSEASGTSFRGNLGYKLRPDVLLYAEWSQGFRLGRPQVGLPAGACDINGDGILDGTNSISIESTRHLNSDNVDNYELGGKFALLDRRATITAAIFSMDWSGLPVFVNAPGTFGSTDGSGCGLAYEANAGEARSEGVELQANFLITESIRVDAGGSYVRAKLTEDALGLTPPAFEGDRLPGSPKVNANLGFQYAFKVGGSDAFVRADAIYIGSFFGTLQAPPVGSTPAGDYVKIDASVRVALGATNVDVFVRNLTNEDAFTWRGAAAPAEGFPFNGFFMRPRTIGLQLSHNF